MSGGLSVRDAAVADAEVVASLMSEFNAVLGADGLPDDLAFLSEHTQVSAGRMASRLQAMSGVETAFIAQLEGVPAGLACLRLVPYIGQEAPYAELTQLFVRQAFKRRGVGAALVAAVEQRAIRAGATCVHIITGRDNHDAQAFYAAQGYAMPGVEFEKHFPAEVR